VGRLSRKCGSLDVSRPVTGIALFIIYLFMYKKDHLKNVVGVDGSWIMYKDVGWIYIGSGRAKSKVLVNRVIKFRVS
jgi:hypothetical protein